MVPEATTAGPLVAEREMTLVEVQEATAGPVMREIRVLVPMLVTPGQETKPPNADR